MSRTVVDLAALQEFESAARTAIVHIDRQLTELRTALAPLRGAWSGDAAIAWAEHQRRWDAAAADLNASLTHLHQVVSTARANYAAALDANVRMWRP